MSELSNNPETLEQYIATREQWLADAAVMLTGNPEADPYTTFPSPTQVRAEAPDPGLDTEQEAAVREIAGRFGVGGEADVPAFADISILEGGKPWKVEAEAKLATGVRIYAGSPNVRIGADEAAYVQAKLLDINGAAAVTQYDMVQQIAELDPRFVPLKKEIIVPFGYKVQEGFEVTQKPTGQLKKIGVTRKEYEPGKFVDEPVYLLSVDRENYIDEEGQPKYRQPDGAALMGIIADVFHDDPEASIGLLTGNTYASRAIDALRAGLQRGREFYVGMYGRQTLADVKGETVAQPTEINQIPGELHVIASKLAKLKAEHQASQQQ